MKSLVVNAGSSSLKFQLFEMPEEKVIIKGLIERIGFEEAKLIVTYNNEKKEYVSPIKDHNEGCKVLLKTLQDYEVIKELEEIKVVGHRVVQGGEDFKDSVVIDDEVITKINNLSHLAPLHNPANLIGIDAFRKVLPNAVQVACFDTTFHQSIPEENFLYPVPYEWYQKYSVRKYGFHGMSHEFIAGETINLLGAKKASRIIVAHMGNGISLTAIKDGKSVDTTMGLTPLDGVPMGTRSGAIDPSIFSYLNKAANLSVDEITEALNKKSGLLGLSQISSDSRDVVIASEKGNKQAILTLNIQAKRIADYIGAYYLLLGGLDALVFTAGIGENAFEVRKLVCDRLSAIGVELDPKRNVRPLKDIIISSKKSKVKVLVIPTNEELMIVRKAYNLAK